jgi:hypothetical protein
MVEESEEAVVVEVAMALRTAQLSLWAMQLQQ